MQIFLVDALDLLEMLRQRHDAILLPLPITNDNVGGGTIDILHP